MKAKFGNKIVDVVPDDGRWLDKSDMTYYNADELVFDNSNLLKAASDLVDAVERYTKPEKGQFCQRSELLNVKDRLKKLISNV